MFDILADFNRDLFWRVSPKNISHTNTLQPSNLTDFFSHIWEAISKFHDAWHKFLAVWSYIIKFTFIAYGYSCPVFIGPDNVFVCKSSKRFLILADEDLWRLENVYQTLFHINDGAVNWYTFMTDSSVTWHIMSTAVSKRSTISSD